jgi:transformation/transcription domain-associated protein
LIFRVYLETDLNFLLHQYDLEHRLAIFVSDEMQFWHSSRKNAKPSDVQLRELTLTNVDAVCRRAKLLSCKMEREKVSSHAGTGMEYALTLGHFPPAQVPIGANPVNQTLLDLVTHATNPLRLASMDPSLLPWL